MSKFFEMDDWEPVDVVSTGIGAATSVCCPGLSIGFSIFMSGETGSTADSTPEPTRQALAAGRSDAGIDEVGGAKKAPAGKSMPRNVFDFLEPPKPSFARTKSGW